MCFLLKKKKNCVFPMLVSINQRVNHQISLASHHRNHHRNLPLKVHRRLSSCGPLGTPLVVQVVKNLPPLPTWGKPPICFAVGHRKDRKKSSIQPEIDVFGWWNWLQLLVSAWLLFKMVLIFLVHSVKTQKMWSLKMILIEYNWWKSQCFQICPIILNMFDSRAF